jgi:hypothetical protein
MENKMDTIFQTPKVYPQPVLKAKEGPVRFPVSYRYNGGCIIDGDWYPGVEVPEPLIPKGYELVGLGCGLAFYCQPPESTQYLQKISRR